MRTGVSPLNIGCMEGAEGFGGLFGDPDELRKRLAEMAEQMQGAQKVAWADNAIKLAVDMTVAAIRPLEPAGRQRRAGDPGPRRDPDRLPRGRHARARSARGPLLGPARFARHPRDAARLASRRAQASPRSRGAASVESIGLALLIVLLVSAVAAAVATGRLDGGRELASTIGRKIRCATQLPGPCWRDPLTSRLRPAGRRAWSASLAPAPAALPGRRARRSFRSTSASAAPRAARPRPAAPA